ncbi:hypothetical protein JCM11251_001550 [Rhodosporidiobolus azoricus]
MGSIAQLYASGLAAYRATSFETAVELFSEAIALNGKSAKLFDARASAYEKLGKVQEGLHDAREVVKLVPASHKGYLRAAKMLKSATKYANAEKLLLQGLERVPEAEEKGQQELREELVALREVRARAEHSPFSQLPLEIFLEIIHLATAPVPLSTYTSAELPLPKHPRPNTLFNAMRVSRTWYQTIKSCPRLWSTLALDGIVNQKNAERKACFILSLACGKKITPEMGQAVQDSAAAARRTGGRAFTSGETSSAGGLRAGGIRRLVLTAAQDFPAPTFTAIFGLLEASSASSTLREVVLSFADGSQTTISAEGEGSRALQLLLFLHEHARSSLLSLSICTGGRIYPDFDLTSVYAEFPRLTELRLCGSTTSNFVFGLRAPFLRHAPPSSPSASSTSSVVSAATSHTVSTTAISTSGIYSTAPPSRFFPPTGAEHLTVLGAVLISDSSLSRHAFPHLKTLELDVLNAGVIWDLLSAPNLTKYHGFVYGEASVLELELPDLRAAWAKVEDLRIGGAKRLAPRLLDHAVSLGPITFPYLTTLDLSYAALSSTHLSLLFSSSTAPHLATVNLASTTVSPPSCSLSLPPRLDALKSLNLSHTLWTTDETIRDLRKCAPALERLEVRGNAFITGRPLMELVRARMPGRSTLSASASSTVEDENSAKVKKDVKTSAGEKIKSSSSFAASKDASSTPRTYSLLTDLALEGCTKIETAAVEWLRKAVRPGGLKLQFLDPGERRKGARWDWAG